MNKKTSSSRRNFLRNISVSLATFTIVPRYVMGRGFASPNDKIRLGFIGTGKQSYGLMRNFVNEPFAEVVACCDVFKSKLLNFKTETEKYIAEKTGKNVTIDTYHEYREMLERSDIDAVIVATPDHWHAIQTIDAMKYGKDVYCEKPLGHTIFEGGAMTLYARSLNRVVQTGSMQRSWENFRYACELVRNGYIGELKEVHVSVGVPPVPYDLGKQAIPEGLDWDYWLGPAPVSAYNQELAPPLSEDYWPRWRNYREFGGGILADWGAHMFDIAQWGMGTDFTGPVEVIPPEDPKDVYGLSLIYQNGVKVVHNQFGRGHAVRFIGSETSLDISRDFLDSPKKGLVDTEIKDTDIHLYRSDNHYRDWLNSIYTRRRPVADVEIGHRSASVCYLADIGYRLNRKLFWNPEMEQFTNDNRANMLITKEYRAPWKFEDELGIPAIKLPGMRL